MRINAAALLLGLLLLLTLAACGQDRQPRSNDGLVSSGLAGSGSGGRPRPTTAEPRPTPQAPPTAPDAPAPTPTNGAVDAAPTPDAAASSATAPRRAEQNDPVAAAGSELLDQTQASRWGIDGSLTADDLTIRMRTDVENRAGEVIGEAGFNLDVVHGFRGIPKCNLLAFEIAYRAGFVVPLVGRSVGWGFPSSEMIGNDARDNRIAGGWAEVRRRPQTAEVNLDRENGMGIMAAARSAIYGRPGHVAIVDWVEELTLTRQGDIRVITFMGWEANTREGARYGRITFATTDAVPTSRFDYIYLLDLRAAEPGNEVALIGRGPRNPTHVLNLEGTAQDNDGAQP